MCSAVGSGLLFIANVMRSPRPLKCSRSSPKPIGVSAVRFCSSASSPPAVWPFKAVGHAHRQLAAAPHVEQRLIVGREQIVAAGIDDAREPEPIQLAEELARSLHLLRERRLRQPIEQRDDGALPAADGAREPLAFALECASGRQISLAAYPERRESVVGHDDPAVAELHVDGIRRRRCFELGLRGPAAFLELQLVPAAGNDEPTAGRPAAGGFADSLQALRAASARRSSSPRC